MNEREPIPATIQMIRRCAAGQGGGFMCEVSTKRCILEACLAFGTCRESLEYKEAKKFMRKSIETYPTPSLSFQEMDSVVWVFRRAVEMLRSGLDVRRVDEGR